MSRPGLMRLVWPVPATLPAPQEPRSVPEAAPPSPRGGPWQRLAAPVYPSDTQTLAIALSALAGMAFQDGSRTPGPLSLAQARDVAAWYRTRRIT